jgi:hypothetical protein
MPKLNDLIVALLGGLPTSARFHMLIPFYPLASICFLLKFLILVVQRRVHNHAREMVCETDCLTVEK